MSTLSIQPDLEHLASRCLAHLEREETLLGYQWERIQSLRAAVMRYDIAALQSAVENLAKLEIESEEVRFAREQLQRDLAEQLGLSHCSALRALAARLGGRRGTELVQYCERVRRLAERVDEYNRVNAAIVRRCLDFQQKNLLALTGGRAAVGSYGPAGHYREGSCDSVIEARG
jgi:hypothetical protein